MATRKVFVERYVEQVRDGVCYRGYVKIEGTNFDYELIFGVPIPELDAIEPSSDESEFRRRFQITVIRYGLNIELTKDEYGFFFSMIVECALRLYNHPQTRAGNRGEMGLLLSGLGPLAEFGGSASVGIKSTASYDFQTELCEMLRLPKFGCAIAT
jgi:hypothetical protein